MPPKPNAIGSAKILIYAIVSSSAIGEYRGSTTNQHIRDNLCICIILFDLEALPIIWRQAQKDALRDTTPIGLDALPSCDLVELIPTKYKNILSTLRRSEGL
jgi:hypothetical protein